MHPAAVKIDGALPDLRNHAGFDPGGGGIVLTTQRGDRLEVIIETHATQRVRQSGKAWKRGDPRHSATLAPRTLLDVVALGFDKTLSSGSAQGEVNR